jgi:hypothetical protein
MRGLPTKKLSELGTVLEIGASPLSFVHSEEHVAGLGERECRPL